MSYIYWNCIYTFKTCWIQHIVIYFRKYLMQSRALLHFGLLPSSRCWLLVIAWTCPSSFLDKISQKLFAISSFLGENPSQQNNAIWTISRDFFQSNKTWDCVQDIYPKFFLQQFVLSLVPYTWIKSQGKNVLPGDIYSATCLTAQRVKQIAFIPLCTFLTFFLSQNIQGTMLFHDTLLRKQRLPNSTWF